MFRTSSIFSRTTKFTFVASCTSPSLFPPTVYRSSNPLKHQNLLTCVLADFAYFDPTIVETYGYSQIGTQLHSVPPTVAAFGLSILLATISDLSRHSFLFALSSIRIAIAGVVVFLKTHHNKHLEHGALFLVAMGTLSAMPMVICWFNMHLRGHNARGVGTAWQLGFGKMGGIMSTFSFLAKDVPLYKTGNRILLGLLCLAALSSILYLIRVWWQNGRREKSSDIVDDDEAWRRQGQLIY